VETPKGKKSYADLAKPYETKKNFDILNNKSSDSIAKNTADMVIKFKQNKLEQLFNQQEEDKAMGKHGLKIQQEAINETFMKYGGLTKAQDSKATKGFKRYSPEIEKLIEEQSLITASPSFDPIWDIQPNLGNETYG